MFFETQEVGHFQKLGSGSYSTVHICELKDGSRVALKRPAPSILEYMHTILREGLLLRLGYGPAFKGIFVEPDGTFFGIGMDLGVCTLSKLREQIELRPRHILNIAHDLMKDIHKLHAHNIVHGDIKLANVIIFQEGAKICDFGLSCWASDAGPSPYTSRDEIYTINYRAPELFDNALNIKTSADIWAFGVTIFGAITSNSLCSFSDKSEITSFITKHFPDDYDTRLVSIRRIIDTVLRPTPLECESAAALTVLIARCLGKAETRPTSAEILDLLQNTSKSFVLEIKNTSPSKTYNMDCALAVAKPLLVLPIQSFTEDTIKLNAKNLLALIKIEQNLDEPIIHLSKILITCMPDWRLNICATLATSLCVMCIRPTHILQPLWCARFMNTSIRDYEHKLGLALTISISYPEWSSEIWAS
jgi:serine/threonine protein kinase